MGLFDKLPGRSADDSQPVADHTATGQARWQAIPAKRSSAPILQARFWLLTGVLLFAAAMGLFAGLSNLSGADDTVDVPLQPEARAFAMQVADDFLNGRQTQLPVADGVDGDFRQPEPDEEGARRPRLGAHNVTWAGFEARTDDSGTDDQTYETHTFELFVGTSPYELTVTVATDAPSARLAAVPSLAPRVLADGGGPAIVWPGRELAYETAPEPMDRRIRQWAQAYVSDDRPELKDVTGDNRVGATYVGLAGGWATDPAQVEIVRIVPGDQDGLFWARVRVPLIRANGWVQRSDYDLLVGNAETDRPTIEAWGPAGTAHELAPLTNAVLTRPNSSQEPDQP